MNSRELSVPVPIPSPFPLLLDEINESHDPLSNHTHEAPSELPMTFVYSSSQHDNYSNEFCPLHKIPLWRENDGEAIQSDETTSRRSPSEVDGDCVSLASSRSLESKAPNGSFLLLPCHEDEDEWSDLCCPISYSLKHPMAAYYFILNTIPTIHTSQSEAEFSTRRSMTENLRRITREELFDGLASAALSLPRSQSQSIATTISLCNERVILWFASSDGTDNKKVVAFYRQLWYHLHQAYVEECRGETSSVDYPIPNSRAPIAKCLVLHGWSRLKEMMSMDGGLFQTFFRRFDRMRSLQSRDEGFMESKTSKTELKAESYLRETAKMLNELANILDLDKKYKNHGQTPIPSSSPPPPSRSSASSPSAFQLHTAFDIIFSLFRPGGVARIFINFPTKHFLAKWEKEVTTYWKYDHQKGTSLYSHKPNSKENQKNDDDELQLLYVDENEPELNTMRFFKHLILFVHNFEAITSILSCTPRKNPWYPQHHQLLSGIRKFQVKPIVLDIQNFHLISCCRSGCGSGCGSGSSTDNQMKDKPKQKDEILLEQIPRFSRKQEWWEAFAKDMMSIRESYDHEYFLFHDPSKFEFRIKSTMATAAARTCSHHQVQSSIVYQDEVERRSKNGHEKTTGVKVKTSDGDNYKTTESSPPRRQLKDQKSLENSPSQMHPELQILIHRLVNSILNRYPKTSRYLGTSHEVCSPCSEVLDMIANDDRDNERLLPLVWSGREKDRREWWPDDWCWMRVIMTPTIKATASMTKLDKTAELKELGKGVSRFQTNQTNTSDSDDRLCSSPPLSGGCRATNPFPPVSISKPSRGSSEFSTSPTTSSTYDAESKHERLTHDETRKAQVWPENRAEEYNLTLKLVLDWLSDRVYEKFKGKYARMLD